MKLLREPLLQFLFLGGLIYLAYAYVSPEIEEDKSRSLVVNAAKIQWMQNTWQKRWNRLPTKTELDALVEQYVKETILYNEAIKMGLDKGDGIIRRQLAKKVEFLAKDLVLYIPPTDEELKDYFQEHRDEYREEPLYSFTQIFFNPDKRGNTTLDDAKKIKEQLIRKSAMTQDHTRLGDAFMIDTYFEANSMLDIRKNFGTGFTQSLIKLKPREWQGPVLSGYGVHIVYIKEVISPPKAEFSKVKETVLQDWTRLKQEELNKQFYARLKGSYVIVVEDENITVLSEKN